MGTTPPGRGGGVHLPRGPKNWRKRGFSGRRRCCENFLALFWKVFGNLSIRCNKKWFWGWSSSIHLEYFEKIPIFGRKILLPTVKNLEIHLPGCWPLPKKIALIPNRKNPKISSAYGVKKAAAPRNSPYIHLLSHFVEIIGNNFSRKEHKKIINPIYPNFGSFLLAVVGRARNNGCPVVPDNQNCTGTTKYKFSVVHWTTSQKCIFSGKLNILKTQSIQKTTKISIS